MSLHLTVPFASPSETIVRVSVSEPVTVVETSFVDEVNSILNSPGFEVPPGYTKLSDDPIYSSSLLKVLPSVINVGCMYPDPPPPAPSEMVPDGLPPPPP